MPSNYKKLGPYIREVNVRNTDLRVTTLLGVSIQKVFMPSIANTVGTDMSTYKIVKKNQFAYGPVTSRNGDKISVALLQNHEEAIISQAYIPFEVVDHNELDPEYLMMWFRRPEFDRYARFKSHGSARETFDWDEMCDTELPIPHIDVQRAMVKEYNTITHRIALNEQLNQKLEETAQTLYRHWFVDFEFPYDFEKGKPSLQGQPYKSSGGEMQWCEELDKEIPRGWGTTTLSNYAEITSSKRIFYSEYQTTGVPFYRGKEIIQLRKGEPNSNPLYISKERFLKISNQYGSPVKNDILLTAVGTVGISYLVDDDNFYFKDGNVIWFRNFVFSEAGLFVYGYLQSRDFKEFLNHFANAAQSAITISALENRLVICPPHLLLLRFANAFDGLLGTMRNGLKERHTLREFRELLLSKMSTVETGVAGGVGVG